MAIHNLSADLLPAFEPTAGRPHRQRPLAHSLPHLAWDRIAYYLSDHLATLLTLADFSPDLKDICRPHISQRYERLHAGERFLYHRVLQLVLQRYVDPSYIYEIECDRAKLNRPRGKPKPWEESLEGLKYRSDAVRPEEEYEDRASNVLGLFREAINSSPWIPEAKKGGLCGMIAFGDPDSALAVLLPLCTKLKTLEVPWDAEYCAAVVQEVAQAYCRREAIATEARRAAFEAAVRDRGAPAVHARPDPSSLPLSELVVIGTADRGWDGCGPPLIDVAAFMGIPSLHRVILTAVRDERFSWPSDYVQSSCPEVWMERSSCIRRAALAFAGAMADSCEIRQQFDLNNNYLQNREELVFTWDSILVHRCEDGSKDINARIAFEGGNPGYDHAWVSWLVWGKMRDWRRLDEEFSLEEGDHDYIELGGSF